MESREYVDLASGTTNTTVRRGNIGTINGSRLQYNPAAIDEGIFFVPTGAGGATQVAGNRVQKNKPGQLVFLVPAAGPTFLPGTYFLEVRARLRNTIQRSRAPR
ncbi:MAG: DUF4469 domain-containing protein [Fimbriimonadales bacterium]